MAESTGLIKAAREIAKEAKLISGRFSRRIPRSIRVSLDSRGVNVQAGGPSAPQARMFETPGARHPLFAHGPRGTDGWRHWYTQPYRPFLEQAAEARGQDACEVYADEVIPELLREFGF